jgi:hypothetical protein
MAFSYDPSSDLGKVRLLVADTDPSNPIFSDAEITAAMTMNSTSFLYVSAQAQPSGLGVATPFGGTSLYRAAAVLLKSIASNKARLAAITQLLDVKLSPKEAATALRDLAADYLEMENTSGAFAIAEMIPDQFAARERMRNQILRLYA